MNSSDFICMLYGICEFDISNDLQRSEKIPNMLKNKTIILIIHIKNPKRIYTIINNCLYVALSAEIQMK